MEDSVFPRCSRFLPGDHAPAGVMHVVDRVVGRQFLLGPDEKTYFRNLLHRLLPFTGIELLTWICLDNHYHLLVRVPNKTEARRLREALSEEEIFRRMEACFSPEFVRETKWRIDAFRRNGKPEMAESILRRLRAQMFDISEFMHMLKRRFSTWYNQRHARSGTLWEGRFRSVLVEEDEQSLLRMAAYIDLNAVRAGLVRDPKDYRWSGYAEAVAGQSVAQNGIRTLVSAATGETAAEPWAEVQASYRCWLYTAVQPVDGADGKSTPRGPSATEVEEVLASGGRLSTSQLLRCRVRYFSDGMAIGSRCFVERVFERYRTRFGPRRPHGARPLRWGEWGGLCSLRDLRKDVIRGSG